MINVAELAFRIVSATELNKTPRRFSLFRTGENFDGQVKLPKVQGKWDGENRRFEPAKLCGLCRPAFSDSLKHNGRSERFFNLLFRPEWKISEIRNGIGNISSVLDRLEDRESRKMCFYNEWVSDLRLESFYGLKVFFNYRNSIIKLIENR